MSLRRFRLPTILALGISALFIVVVGAFTALVAKNLREDAQRSATARAEIAGKAAEAAIRGYFADSLARAKSLAAAVEATNGTDNNRRFLDDLVRRSIAMAPDSYFGVWVVMRPTELGGTNVAKASDGTDSVGIFAPYWVRDGASVKRNDDLSTVDTTGEYSSAYYALPEQAGLPLVTPPYLDESNGVVMASSTMPVKRDGKVVGVVGFDVSLVAFSKILAEINPFNGGDITVFAGKTVVASSKADLAGKSVDSVPDARRDGRALIADDRLSLAVSVPIDDAGSLWTLQLEVPLAILMTDANRTIQWLVLAGILACLLGIGGGWIFGRRIANPILQVAGGMEKLAAGELTAERAIEAPFPEVQRMSACLDRFRADAAARNRLEAEAEREQAAKLALTRRLDEMLADFHTNATATFTETANAMDALLDASGELDQTAHVAAEEARRAAGVTDETVATVRTLANAAVRMEQSAAAIQKEVTATTRIVEQSKLEADVSVSDIRQLTEAASAIGNVVEIIRAIADQTSLLALNASIEAARAGDAGRGFSVVAGEVKALAEQTAKATAEIAERVSAIQSRTDNSASRIAAIADTMDRINSMTRAIAGMVEQQSQETQAITQSSSQAAEGTGALVQSVGSVSAMASRTTSTSDMVRLQSTEMKRRTEQLSGEIDRFVAAFRQGPLARS